MKKVIYKSQAIQAVIIMAAAILLLSLWPLRIWHETVTSSVGIGTEMMTEAIDNGRTALQVITAQYNHMDTISLYLNDDCSGESFYVNILDEKWQPVCEEKVVIDYDALPGYQEALIDIDMEVNTTYYVTLQGNDSEVFVGFETVSPEEKPWLGTLFYCDSTVEGRGLVADYHYSVPLRKTKVLLFGLAILLAAALLVFAVKLYYQKKEDKLITAEKAFRCTMNPLVAAGTLFCLFAVLMGACGHYILDNAVFCVSVLLLSAVLFYGINHDRTGQEPILTIEYLKTHFRDLFQSVCIAGAVAACCEYMNGLYDVHHAVATRKELIWFALAVIAMFQWKEIFNLYNAVYLAAAGLWGYRYYQLHLTEDMDDFGREILKLTVWTSILLGLVLIRTVIGLWKKKLIKPAYLYAGLLFLFFALIIIFRNGRWWGIAMVTAFTLFYLNYGMWEHRERLLANVTRGVALQFLLATGYCLLHRPFTTFRNARYPHIFHTVTITAAYLTMAECVAAVIFLQKYRKSQKLRDFWKELFFFGIVTSYMIFTMARTGYFAAGAAVLLALIMTAFGKGKKWRQHLGKSLCLMLLSIAVCLPVTFTIQRTVPALVSEPRLNEIEYAKHYPEAVLRGRNLSSIEYIRVGRFIDLFCDKILGIPEGTLDIYGEIAEYNRTHDEFGRELPNTSKGSSGSDFAPEILGVSDSSKLVASLNYEAELAEADVKEASLMEDYTNGRLDIFKSYIEQLNLTGHEEMGAVLRNGEIATHAHNIYLQVAYDHGIGVGVVFVFMGIATFIAGCLYYHKKKDTINYAALPAVITVAVAAAGVAEWVYHLSNPCGFLLMLVITPLVYGDKTKAES